MKCEKKGCKDTASLQLQLTIRRDVECPDGKVGCLVLHSADFEEIVYFCRSHYEELIQQQNTNYFSAIVNIKSVNIPPDFCNHKHIVIHDITKMRFSCEDCHKYFDTFTTISLRGTRVSNENLEYTLALKAD